MKALSLLTLFLLFSLVSCQNSGTESQDQTKVSAEVVSENLLSPEEVDEGWQLLFDGNSLDGWHSYGQDSVSGWMIEAGQLTNDPEIAGGDITTNNEYTNYELSLEWKVAEGGNSGIIYRVIENSLYEGPPETGPEYQLIDDIGYPGDLKDGQLTAANYDMHPPQKSAFKGANVYHHAHIIINDSLVEHYLDGELIVSYKQWSEDWEERRKISKWVNYPGYGTAKSGKIALQDHGNRVWFKNIKIKPLR
ncbi:MAG: DUF1080 domain-containing protein [Bacteroidota bacterium]